jgi:glyoxylase-like metal-dependent hydrolase (beta-lactamase superfamily II)
MLIATPGHTPGHQSVVLETDEGLSVIAAQAAYTADEFRRGGDAAVHAHEGFEVPYTQSIGRIKAIGARKILFSHDSDEVNL